MREMGRKRLVRECSFCDASLRDQRLSNKGLCGFCWEGEPGKWARGESVPPPFIASRDGKMRLVTTPEYDLVFL